MGDKPKTQKRFQVEHGSFHPEEDPSMSLGNASGVMTNPMERMIKT